jgi:hypothetical protein
MGGELQSLLEQRKRLDERIGALQKAVVACEAAMAAVATSKDFKPLSAETEEQVLGPRITEKIKYVLIEAEEALTAREILDGLAEFGYRFGENERPMATVHSICNRLATAKPKLVEETAKDGRKAWKSLGLSYRQGPRSGWKKL